MLFNSEFFLFFFLPIVFLLFSAIRTEKSSYILLFASMFFYAWGEPRFFPIILISIFVDYWLGNIIARRQKPLLCVTVGIVLNALLLIYFKYMDFFITTANNVLSGHQIPLMNIALPIGVSFIVFEKITYLVDIYRGQGAPATSIKNYLLYVFLFPKLLAGPIIKYHDIAPQLGIQSQTMEDILVGFKRFLLGLIKKVLLADTLGEVADSVFTTPETDLVFFQAWFGVVCYTLQIYMDFSAYSDMAIGLCRMFGFRLLENFNMPYISQNFTEFWRRWHISLSSWIKEYLYIPMGGNQKSTVKTYFNLWICFLLSGLWHGANWTFVLWGAYNGIFLIFDRLFWIKVSHKLPKALNVSITLFFIMIGWAIFRSDSFEHLSYFFKALFTPATGFLYVTQNVWAAFFVCILICIAPIFMYFEALVKAWSNWKPAQYIENWALCVLGACSILRIMSADFNPFLYFRF